MKFNRISPICLISCACSVVTCVLSLLLLASCYYADYAAVVHSYERENNTSEHSSFSLLDIGLVYMSFAGNGEQMLVYCRLEL